MVGGSEGLGVLGREKKSSREWDLLFWGKLSVTALRVHHFPPRSNCSRFHPAALLSPPRCTTTVTRDRTEMSS